MVVEEAVIVSQSMPIQVQPPTNRNVTETMNKGKAIVEEDSIY